MMDVDDDRRDEDAEGSRRPASSALLLPAAAAAAREIEGEGARDVRTAPAAAVGGSNNPNNVGDDFVNDDGDEAQNVRVVARIRPLSSREASEGGRESISADTSRGVVSVRSYSEHVESTQVGDGGNNGGGEGRKFAFDSVFGPKSSQREVYERACGDMITKSIFRGFNATILAYGQTGSGKTYTMGTDGGGAGAAGDSPRACVDDGEDDDALTPTSRSSRPPSRRGGGGGEEESEEDDGVIARAVRDLFDARDSLPNGRERVRVVMSYLEIYNERAIDLLAASGGDGADEGGSASTTTQSLQVRDSKSEGGVVVPGLTRHDVSCPGEVMALMVEASGRRATGSTRMNSVSSRSHAICTLSVTIGPDLDTTGGSSSGGGGGGEEEGDGGNPGEGGAIVSPRSASQSVRAKLTLVDLAGSERLKRTGAEGARLKEGININKGLFVLGQVVSALSEMGQQNGHGGVSHIPYRDSKLTRLLQDSLGGNSRTVMIACISPADSNVEESVNTLRYAERTRNIKNSAVRNVVSAGLSAAEAAALRRENQQLKLELARMESRLIMGGGGGSGGGNGAGGFHFGGAGFASGTGAATSGANAETVSQLQAQCSSLLAENDLLKGRAREQAKEVLVASLRADKWQAKSEAVANLAMKSGVALPDVLVNESVDVVSQLRNQLAECKGELMEARTEAAVARATAGAVIAGNVDLAGIEDALSSNEDASAAALASDDGAPNNDHLTTELTAVSATIEQKEAMVQQMNKERSCMDKLQLHFEQSLRLLQAEMDAVAAERDELVVKVSSNENDNAANAQQRRKRKAGNDPVTKRLREQICKLESRIDELKLKASEHKRSLKMKEEAQKKCEKLMSEIAEDKQRRAELQRKLKEASVEMRAEKRAAQQKATRMMKDSQKLKIELTKMKAAAQKQAAVLKRKIDQASAKEKARAELERKRRTAEKMRLASSSAGTTDVSENKKAELSSWIDREVEYAQIKYQIDEQRRKLDKVISQRKKLVKTGGDSVEKEELCQMDATIQSLRSTVQNLEVTVKKAFPTAAECNPVANNFRFLETDTFKTLSKPDAKFVLSYIFDLCSTAKQEMATMVSNQDATTKTNVDAALAKEQEKHEKEVMKLRMEHAQVTVNLLESTQGTLNSNIKLKMCSDDTEEEVQAKVDGILEAYNESWTAATEGLKFDLDEIKETQDGLQTMMANMAKGMSFVPKKAKAKKQKMVEHGYDSEAFESGESFLEEEGDDDSEYEPTPAKSKAKRRSPRIAKKKEVAAPDSPSSPIGENFIDDLDSKKVQSLKKACKKLNVPVTGKKDALKQRVREAILNSSVALPNPDEESDESFSTTKRVNFEADVAVDPEFQPIDEDQEAPSESIKKQLWDEADNPGAEEAVASADKTAKPRPSLPARCSPKNPFQNILSKRTPKRKKSPGGDEEDSSATPSKRHRPLGFLSSSPRPLSAHNAQQTKARTPVHLKQTAASSKKRLSQMPPGANAKRSITSSVKKRTLRGMNAAVAQALEQNNKYVKGAEER